MRVKGIQSVIRRKKKRYAHAQSTPRQVVENLHNRDFTAEPPNEEWLTNVTEFAYGNCRKVYLSAILDLHDNVVILYWGIPTTNPLVFQTLELTLIAAPESKPILHSDRGFQYTSLGFKRITDENKLILSMSRVGRFIECTNGILLGNTQV